MESRASDSEGGSFTLDGMDETATLYKGMKGEQGNEQKNEWFDQ
jgi:hypothetical protein